MAAHLSSLRVVSLLSLFAIALTGFSGFPGFSGTARADHYLTHPAKATGQAAERIQPAPRNISELFRSGAEIKVKRDANVYVTPRNIPKNDRLLRAYSIQKDRKNGVAAQAPGLLGIAAQAYRSQDRDGQNKAYSLADAMRDAIWRKKTSARLKTLMSRRDASCANEEQLASAQPSIGLVAAC